MDNQEKGKITGAFISPNIIIILVGMALTVYLISFLPNFALYHEQINFILLAIVWITLQYIFIYAGFKLFRFIFTTFKTYEKSLYTFGDKIFNLLK